MELEEHLFRHESGRLVSILTRLFGVQNLSLAEDVVQDAFCRALETWKFHGVPKNPAAWLMTTAKRRALDALRREGTTRKFESALAHLLESEWTRASAIDEAFASGGLNDAQLRMMFTCVQPTLPEETQVALILNLLCGFSVAETAAAFLKNPAATEKRIMRAKKMLAQSTALFDLDSAEELKARLPAVLRAIYLLFNEGYHSASPETATRIDLCDEALRLVYLLLECPPTALPIVHALAALLNFHSARMPGRLDAKGNLAPLFDQDRNRWNQARIAEGHLQLEHAAAGGDLTAYHLESAIAAEHASAASIESTNWNHIVSLYDMLMRVQPSPVVALNRAIAVAQAEGPARGLEETEKIAGRNRLARYPFYFAARGEFEFRLGHLDKANELFGSALRLARNPSEARFIEERMRQTRS
ncbi:MAG: RNA polymerase sigma factor [Rudaea sp.]